MTNIQDTKASAASTAKLHGFFNFIMYLEAHY